MEKVARAELPYFVRNVLAALSLQEKKEGAMILALSGELGAGKTTFVQTLARELGVTEQVQSPTYVLMKSYPIAFEHWNTLVHIDAYRLQTPEEFLTLRPQEFLSNPHALVVVEWPEKAQGVLPKADLTVNFSSEGAGEEERYIELV